MYAGADLPIPRKQGYTVYSKSGCNYCSKAKSLLEEQGCEYILVDCDPFLSGEPERKTQFLERMGQLIGKPYRTFPMIFKDALFLGGFQELEKLHSISMSMDLDAW